MVTRPLIPPLAALLYTSLTSFKITKSQQAQCMHYRCISPTVSVHSLNSFPPTSRYVTTCTHPLFKIHETCTTLCTNQFLKSTYVEVIGHFFGSVLIFVFCAVLKFVRHSSTKILSRGSMSLHFTVLYNPELLLCMLCVNSLCSTTRLSCKADQVRMQVVPLLERPGHTFLQEKMVSFPATLPYTENSGLLETEGRIH